MAYITGTATGFQDFLNQLKTNLTANNWSNVKDSVVSNSRELYFKNTVSNIVIGFKEVSSTDYANLLLNCPLDYSSTYDFYLQPGSCLHQPNNISTGGYKMPVMSLQNNPITFWLFVNNNRVIIVCKISGIYVSAYIGKFDQLGTPSQYPNPVFVGGNAGSETMLLSNTSSSNNAFLFKGGLDYGPTFKKYNNQWCHINTGTSFVDTLGKIYPTSHINEGISYSTSGIYDLEPIILYDEFSCSGELDGIFWLSGRGQSSENTINVEGVNYIVFQNIFRTTTKDFYCIKAS